MEFVDFWDRAKVVEQERSEEQRARMVAGAHLATQLGAGTKGDTFEDYCRRLGLVERPAPLTAEQKRLIAEHAKRKAEKIASMPYVKDNTRRTGSVTHGA